MNLADIIGRGSALGEAGFYEFFLPFILVFAIIFAILDSIDIFKRRSSTLVAVVIALLITANPAFMTWYSHFTAMMSMYFAVVAFGMVLLLLMTRPFAPDGGFFGEDGMSIKMLFFGAIIIVGLLMFSAGGAAPLPPGVRGIVGGLNRADIYTLIILGGIFVLIIFTSSEKSGTEKERSI